MSKRNQFHGNLAWGILIFELHEPFYRNNSFQNRFETNQFLPRVSSTCGLALHACDLVKKVFLIQGVHLGGIVAARIIGWQNNKFLSTLM